MEQLYVLNVGFDFGYGKETIFPVILKDKYDMILVDCGYTDFLPKLEQAAYEQGVDFSLLTKVMITHHDHDHMGSLAAIKRKYPYIQIIASEKDEPYVSGKLKSLRLEQAESMQLTLPHEHQESGRAFQEVLKAVENVEVDLTVKDGDYFPWCGGIEIVETPGHMPGHISVYSKKHKALISGDALALENGKLEIAAPQFILDMNEAKKSVLRLLDFDIETIICYHGGEYKGDIKEELKRLY